MSCRVLRSTDIYIDSPNVFFVEPIIKFCFACKSLFVFGINITQEIPRTSRPAGHRIRLISCSGPCWHTCERTFSGARWLITFYVRKLEWQFLFRDFVKQSFRIFRKGNRFTPISLTSENRIANFVADFLCCETMLYGVVGDRVQRIPLAQSKLLLLHQ